MSIEPASSIAGLSACTMTTERGISRLAIQPHHLLHVLALAGLRPCHPPSVVLMPARSPSIVSSRSMVSPDLFLVSHAPVPASCCSLQPQPLPTLRRKQQACTTNPKN